MGKPNALSQQSDHGDGKQDSENIVLLKPELFMIRALEGLTIKGEKKDIVREIQKNKEGEVEMQVTAAVKELKRGNQRSMRGEEWKEQNGLILFQDIAKLLLNTMTPALLDTWEGGRHSNLSPNPPGGHKCHDT
jgi:hypothetical protein